MLDPQAIKTRIREHLLESFPHDGVELTETTDLFQEWFVDSMGVVLLVCFLEEEFDVDVRRGDIQEETFRTIDAIATYVLSRKGGLDEPVA